MPLLGQLLLAESIQNEKFLSKGAVLLVTTRGQFDRHNDLSVGDHHHHTAEKRL